MRKNLTLVLFTLCSVLFHLKGKAQINAQFLGRYSIGTYNSNGGVAEISAFDPSSKRMFVINGPDSTVKIVNIANPANPVLITTLSIKPYGIDVNSIACNKKGLIAMAVVDSNGKTNASSIVFTDINGNFISKVKAGANTDHIIFTSDGNKLICANEGEPNVGYTIDPEGSISIIDLSGGAASLTQANVQTAGFTAFNSPAVIDSKIRIFGKIQSGGTFLRNSTVAEDLEPEYITISEDNSTAWVTCQENNAIAVVNINTATVTSLLPLGYKNHVLLGNGLDPSDRDNGSNGALAKIDTFPVFGLFLPDGISSFKSGSQTYLITANEGDARADWGTANVEENRVGDAAYVLDTTKFGGATGVAAIKANTALGRLTVTNRYGDFDNDGKFDSIFAFGGRSFSIWNSTTGALVWDSKDEFEQITKNSYSAYFNAGHTTNALDDRSDNKGPEPESVTIGKIKDSIYAFVALERIGGIMIYNITNPTAPYFVQYINSRNFSVTPSQANLSTVGDLGPEGIAFIPSSESPNGVNMIMLSNEVSGTVAFYTLNTPETEGITKLQDYKNNTSAAIGTFQGINYKEAGFSTLFPIPNTNGTEFWTCSDRGVNIDCANANTASCRPTYDKMYAFPSYTPKIHRIRIVGDSIQILQSITIKRPNGTGATGIINPTGLGSTAAEVASTDTVQNCANFNLKTTPKDTFGIDPEGLVVDKAGNFWLCEEGGATIWQLNPNGVLIKRYTPYAHLAGKQSVDVQIDSVFKYRKNNRGFEGISIAPNGKIYAMIQSGILYPTATVGDNSRVHRILEIDPATGNQRMIVYLNDGIIGASGANQIRLSDWKIGDMAAINDSTFLVLEAAARGTSDIKRLYKININQATAVHSGLYGTNTLEGLVDSTGLAAYGIKAVSKTLVIDLLASGWPAVLDKAEGLAIINDSTIAIGNDNDFGQKSALANGIATATGNLSHVITYRISGAKKLANYKPAVLSVSSQSAYVTPAAAGVKIDPILTVGDAAENGYKMVGIPDGTGAYDNNNGTFTLLVNHELGNTVGINRAHGAKGAFVSKWVINKNDLSVVSGADLIQKVNLYTTGIGYTLYNPTDTTSKKAFARFCSADLPSVSAFYNALTGLGTQERIFMNGEESGIEGRAFGHIATGTNAGTTYELPNLGKFSWENAVASPVSGDKTVVAGMDDGTDGQVYFYIGTKTNTGNEMDKAGLTNGRLYGIAVTGLPAEISATVPAPNTAFTMVDLGVVKDSTGLALNNRSNALSVTKFLRPEDGAFDPSNPNDFYFVTTNAFTAPSKMWRLRFNDIKNPTTGGTITAVLDGTEGPKMMDNIGIDNSGHIIIQEDVGNNVHIGKTWQYTIANDKLTLIASHDSTRFINGAANYLTQDEEGSGIIDVQDILGAGNFLLVDQAHYATNTEFVEGGQILKMFNPTTAIGEQLISIGSSRSINNDTVRVRGVITRAWGRFIYIQDSTGAIAVRQSSGAMVDSILSSGLKEGDFVEVVGGRGDFNNYSQINIGNGAFGENSRVTKLSTNATIPAPILVTLKQINTNGEQYESKLVRIVGLKTNSTAATFAASSNTTVWDGPNTGDSTILRVIAAQDTEVEDAPAVTVYKGSFIFEGILAQFCSSPTNGCALGYQLYGVRKKDIMESPLSAFNLLNPTNNTRINTDSANTSAIQINWNSSVNATKYKWFLTSATGSFSTPLLVVNADNAGADTLLSLTSGGLDAMLANLSVSKGDSIKTKWTVYAYKGVNDSLQATQVFNITLARNKAILGAFNLSAPANNTRLVVEEANTTAVNINWTKSTNAITYKWFLTTAAGNFATPLLRLNANNFGADSILTITSGALDNVLNSLSIKRTDSTVLKWTVYAYLTANDSLKASQDWNINVIRKRILSSFNLTAPANNARVEVEQNNTTPIVITWSASANATKYKWKAATLTGNFTAPLLNMDADNTGADAKLTLTSNALDVILANNGIAKGDSLNLKWTVYAYETTDSLQSAETFNVKLVRMKNVGIPTISSVENINVFPNPSNSDATLAIQLQSTEHTVVSLLDIQGKAVVNVLESDLTAGQHNVNLQTANLQNGVYFVRVTTGNKTTTIKLVVMH
ncbi:MAG: choice-of-anchor I family protein [Bacteroidota bacterium]